ncbi:MAG: hypothetical protein IKA65_08415 [Lentisphaeria bacterium]|nr:hypothetical protein [Lentisphaeria bacterium]
MIRKNYLKRCSEAVPIEPCAFAGGHTVVIPVYDENAFIAPALKALKSALQRSPEPVKVLLVINEPAHAPPAARQNNQLLLTGLRKNDGKYDGTLVPGSELFFIDLTNKEIPQKFRNVGNARKVGFDQVILQSDGKVTDKDPLLFSLDADTLVAPDYFEQAFAWAALHPHAAGAVFHFEHRWESPGTPSTAAAMRYEIYLRDYAWKLRDCGSAYGFWTIGSAFMCRMSDYMRCGGMRRCAAGEDFYFLQALRKVGEIGVVKDTTVYPSARISQRVPFGTGLAVEAISRGKTCELYNPQPFSWLKAFFLACRQADLASLSGDITAFAPAHLAEYLAEQNFAGVWQKIVKNTPKSRSKLLNRLHSFCDSFFIMKFCHYLEELYPAELGKIPLTLEDDELEEYLTNLRRLDRQRFN